MKQLFFVMFVLLCVSIQASAALTATLPQLLEALRMSGEKYEVVGTVCEQVAKLQMQQTYPAPRYNVVTGIAYDNGGRTIGELDVVVFDTATNNSVVIVGEVKCWNSFQGAINKARDQRQRFLTALGSGKKLNFECTNHTCRYDKQNFKSVQKFISISQQGGVSAGFDMELPYPLKDLMKLRQQMMACQSSGDCLRSRY